MCNTCSKHCRAHCFYLSGPFLFIVGAFSRQPNISNTCTIHGRVHRSCTACSHCGHHSFHDGVFHETKAFRNNPRSLAHCAPWKAKCCEKTRALAGNIAENAQEMRRAQRFSLQRKLAQRGAYNTAPSKRTAMCPWGCPWQGSRRRTVACPWGARTEVAAQPPTVAAACASRAKADSTLRSSQAVPHPSTMLL